VKNRASEDFLAVHSTCCAFCLCPPLWAIVSIVLPQQALVTKYF
jgi:hypothetical protein